jgi:hypothetical protein
METTRIASSERDTEDFRFVPEGNLRSAQFGKPTAAAGAREIQLGVRVEY